MKVLTSRDTIMGDDGSEYIAFELGDIVKHIHYDAYYKITKLYGFKGYKVNAIQVDVNTLKPIRSRNVSMFAKNLQIHRAVATDVTP